MTTVDGLSWENLTKNRWFGGTPILGNLHVFAVDDLSIERLGMFPRLFLDVSRFNPFTSIPADAGSMIYVQARGLFGMQMYAACGRVRHLTSKLLGEDGIPKSS